MSTTELTQDTGHRQVPALDFQCDEEIAELVTLMNELGIETLLSCQDNDGGRGAVRRVWVEILGCDLSLLLELLDRPGEADMESLSNRMANEYEPDDWREFRENRQWHYATHVDRADGELVPPMIGIRFPYTDLGEVVTRLRATRDSAADA